MKFRIFIPAFILGILVLVVDQLTKVWALSHLQVGERLPLLGSFLGIELFYNAGAAFSSFTSATVVLTLLATLVVLILPFIIARTTSLTWAIALFLIWGGAGGNLVDRLIREPGIGRGYVVDFISYGTWFVGNVADIALVVGVVLAFIAGMLSIDFAPSATQSQKGENPAPREEKN